MVLQCYSKIGYDCSDIWKPYLKVIKETFTDALHILDRFHLVPNLSKALGEIRADEARKIKRQDALKHTKYSSYEANVITLSMFETG